MFNRFYSSYYTTETTSETFTVNVSVPGNGPEDVTAEVRNKKLHITTGEDKWVLTIPDGYDAGKTVATVKNGVLKLVVPASEVNKTKIAVTAG